MDYDIDLVPGRDCGDCTVCCTVMAIDKPEIQKEAGLTCKHCTGTGCAIYETRPPLCRGYHCGWRQLPILDESWRPDLSGVLVEMEPVDDVTGLCFTLIDNPLKTVRQPWFIDFVAIGVSENIPLLLGLPGPRGHQGASVLLNTDAMRAASFTSQARVKELLEADLKRLRHYDFQPREIVNTGNNVGKEP